jgi:hypothetical protein
MSETLPFNEALRLNSILATLAVESIIYKSWSDEFRVSNIRKEIDKLKDQYNIDPYLFTSEQLMQLGFGKWTEYLRLVPLGLFPFLKEGTLLTSIMEKSVVVGIDEIDNDARFGYISYGIIVKDE